MYAIVDIAGQQFKVEKDKKVFVHRLENELDTQVSFDKVLLIDNNGTVTVGAPVINGAGVVAKVVEHLKGDKVFVFKKKRRKGYRKFNGHRQYLTQIVIEDIVENGFVAQPVVKKAKAAKPVEVASDEAVAETKTVKKEAKATETKTKAAPKAAAAKKPAAKKPAAKKPAAKKPAAKKTEKE